MFKFSEDHSYYMPAHFGWYEKQLSGYVGHPIPVTYHDVSTMVVTYETDREMLERYVPAPFEVREPVLSVAFTMNRGVEWLAGGDYKLVAIDVPVAYRHGGEDLEGGFSLVVWESKATPCFPGREAMGIPKIFADIEDFHQLDDRLFSHASYEGTPFVAMEVHKKRRLSPEEVAGVNQGMAPGGFNWFGWRYIPNLGKPGAALSHATVFPQDCVFQELYEAVGTVNWKAVTWEQNPAQAHIINALAGLPVKEYRLCYVSIGGRSVMRSDLARQLP